MVSHFSMAIAFMTLEEFLNHFIIKLTFMFKEIINTLLLLTNANY